MNMNIKKDELPLNEYILANQIETLGGGTDFRYEYEMGETQPGDRKTFVVKIYLCKDNSLACTRNLSVIIAQQLAKAEKFTKGVSSLREDLHKMVVLFNYHEQEVQQVAQACTPIFHVAIQRELREARGVVPSPKPSPMDIYQEYEKSIQALGPWWSDDQGGG